MNVNELKLNLNLILGLTQFFCIFLGSDEPILGELWNPGQPDFFSHARCANMNDGRILLADVECSRLHNFLCEI